MEAAHALAEVGRKVLLVSSEDAKLPSQFSLPVLRLEANCEPPRGWLDKMKRECHRVIPGKSTLLHRLEAKLVAEGITPSAYLLNSSDYFDPSVRTFQAVVGWGFPTRLGGYVGKIGTYGGWRLSRSGIRSTMDQFGWYLKDWRAYRHADRVLAVSQRINAELQQSGVRSVLVHPGTGIQAHPPALNARSSSPPRLLIAAAELDDSRKRVEWMLNALAAVPRRDYQLTLAGKYSDALKAMAESNNLPCTFIGLQPRERLQELMAVNDIFLFGSRLDDWGYVLVEAMAAGEAVVAANISPFDEIVGSAGALYQWDDPRAFTQAVFDVIDNDRAGKQLAAYDRAQQLFSRRAFADALSVALPSASFPISVA